MAFTVAISAMSDETSYYDESLPNFDRNTIENILMCQQSDEDDMRKLDQLCSKMISEIKYRAKACMNYLETEQKLLNDDHHMYPEHFELLSWILSIIPFDMNPRNAPADL